MEAKKKNPNAVALGRRGGNARDKDELRAALAKGRAVWKRSFASEEERSAYYAMIGAKGRAVRAANKKRAASER